MTPFFRSTKIGYYQIDQVIQPGQMLKNSENNNLRLLASKKRLQYHKMFDLATNTSNVLALIIIKNWHQRSTIFIAFRIRYSIFSGRLTIFLKAF